MSQQISRRNLLAFGGFAAAGLFAPVAPAQVRRMGTPAQPTGPFYPDRLPADMDGDLVKIAGRSGEATGEILKLEGRLLDLDGRPVPRALVEIWQVDGHGHYLAEAGRVGLQALDQNFQGYGRVESDGEGRYAFRTVKPVPYTGRTPHIHVRVRPPRGQVLTTQMYLAGEPGNARDFLYRSLTPDQQAMLTVALSRETAAPQAGWTGRFDMVLA